MKSIPLAALLFPALASANPSFDFTKIEVSALRFCDAKAEDFRLPESLPQLIFLRPDLPRQNSCLWTMPHVVVDGTLDYKMMVARPGSNTRFALIVKEVDLSSSREISRR